MFIQLRGGWVDSSVLVPPPAHDYPITGKTELTDTVKSLAAFQAGDAERTQGRATTFHEVARERGKPPRIVEVYVDQLPEPEQG